MIRILDKYVGWIFLGSYLTCLFFFVGLFLIVDFFSRLDDFLDAREYLANTHDTLLGLIFRYYLLSVPTVFSQVAPFVTLMGAMFAVTRLSRSNELIPMVSSGLSTYRILAPLFLFAFVLTGAMIALQQFAIPRIGRAKEAIEEILDGRDPRFIRMVKESDRMGNRFDIGRYDPERRRMLDLDVTTVNPPIRVVEATAAEWTNGKSGEGWYLTGGYELITDNNGNVERRPKGFLDKTDLSPADLELASVDDFSILSFSEINRLYHRYPERNQLKLLLHSQITFPLSNVILLLLGIPFVINRKVKSPFLSVGICLLICGSFFATDFVARDLGQRGFYPVTMAWLPGVLFASIGICMFDAIRT